MKKEEKKNRRTVGREEAKKLVDSFLSDFDEEDAALMSSDGSIRGTVESIVYRNTSNGYTVITFDASDRLISATGIMPDINEGDLLSLIGKWEVNPRYGKQLSVIEYRPEIPTEAADIEKYLASGAIKGIGPKTARKIVETFGPDTSDVIENRADWLSQIPGITLKRAREISEEFKSKSDMRAVMAFFREYFGPALTMKIYREYGKNSVETAKANPYRLSDEIDGITFEAADAMGMKLGIDTSSPLRIASGIKYVLSLVTVREGHSCYPYNDLVRAACDILKADSDTVLGSVKELLMKKQLILERMPDGSAMIYDRQMYEDEKYIAMKLLTLNRGGAALDFADIEGFIRMSQAQNGISYDDDQRRAIVSALSRGVLLLTGGPGTGKTTVITALIGIFENLNFKLALAAPTGRAAKRMTEATGREAKTVHRLLEVEYDGTENSEKKASERLSFKRNEKNLLEEDAVIIDEVSMMDTALTASLLRAVRPGARLIFIGDRDQLPSVGPGNVLSDLLSSGTLPVVTLSHIFRQAESSLIVTNAHAINRGEMPVLDSHDRDFFFLRRENDRDIAALVADLCSKRLPAAYGDTAVQVIVPSRKGQSGTEQLNSLLQNLMNPAAPGKKEWKRGDTVFRNGDKVMQVRNNYLLEWRLGTRSGQGIFNGDIGTILNIDIPGEYMDMDFDGRRVVYSFSDLGDLEPAYAITVHKSQGSEYPIVVIPLGSIPPMLRTRNLLYTAVTRARQRVVVVGMTSILEDMVSNAKPAVRYTGLCRRLQNLNSGGAQ